jgi:hypothetical protein
LDDRVPEDLAPLHPQLADRAGGGNAAIDIKQVVVSAIGVEPGGEHARSSVFLRLQDERAGAVAEAGRRSCDPPNRAIG